MVQLSLATTGIDKQRQGYGLLRFDLQGCVTEWQRKEKFCDSVADSGHEKQRISRSLMRSAKEKQR